MKSICAYLFLFIFFSFKVSAQAGCNNGWPISLVSDSCDFSSYQSSHFYYEIDTSYPNNIWQVGAVTKSGFLASQYGGKAIQTDTLNPYPINNTSVFYVWKDTSYYNGFPDTTLSSLIFWHYYDVDSLSDSCLVQITTDSGLTWKNYNEYNGSGSLAFFTMLQII